MARLARGRSPQVAFWYGLALAACAPSAVQSTSAPRQAASQGSADADADAPAPLSNGAVDCVAYRSEARYRGVGYDHLVTLQNECEVQVHCSVSTNVNPQPVQATLSPGQRVTLLTFRGSPARSFVAYVTCKESS